MLSVQAISSKVQTLTKDDRSKRVFKNVLNSFLVKIFSTVVTLSLIPVSIKYVNKESYGVWLTISSVITWINVFDFGLSNGLTNKLTEVFAVKNNRLARVYLSTSYAILLLITGALLLLYFIAAPFINWNTVFNTTIDKATLSDALNVTFVSFCLLFLFKPLTSLLRSLQMHFLNNIIQLIGNALALVIIFCWGGNTADPFLFLAVVMAMSYPVTLLIASVILFATRYKHLKPSYKSLDFSLKRILFGLSIKFFVIQLSVLAIFTSNNLVISYFDNNESVTYYNIAYRYFSIITIFQTLIMTPLWTAFTDAYTLRDFSWIKDTVTKMNRLNVLLCAALIFMVMASNMVYKIWIGSDIVIPAELNILFGVYMAVTIFKETYNSFVNGVGKLNLQVVFSIVTIILQLPLAYLLIRVWDLKLAGLLYLNIFWMGISLLLYYRQYNIVLTKPAYKKIWN